MPRDKRPKPSNVVKSRSAPSLLGNYSQSRKHEALPSNRFIELGDIALGNQERRHAHESYNYSTVEERPAQELIDVNVLTEVQRPPKAAKLRRMIVQPPKPPRGGMSGPLTRPKPPRLASVRLPKTPKLPLPPKAAPPKPPKVNRPKPVTNRPGKTTHAPLKTGRKR